MTRPALSLRWSPLTWLLALTVVHGCLYAAVVPPWQVPDENVRYEYLRGLASATSLFPSVVDRSAAVYQQIRDSWLTYRWWEFFGLPLPTDEVRPPPATTMGAIGGWSLYYRLSMPLYWLVSSWPIVNQLYVLRLYSVALQCLTVWLTYHLARLIFSGAANPAAQVIPAAAALVVAIFPQYAFISAGYNDDNLVPPLVAGALYAVLKGLSKRGDYRWLALAGGLAFLAFLTKRTSVSLVILIGLCLLVYAAMWLRSTGRGPRLAGLLVIGVAVAAGLALLVLVVRPPRLSPRLAALLNLRTTDWLALMVYVRAPARLLQIDWVEPLLFFSVSFWGWFGWLTAPLDATLMVILRGVSLLLIAGCVFAGLRHALASRPRWRVDFQLGALLLLGLGLILGLGVMVAQFLVGPPAYALTGRYLFPFISALGILAVWGWQAWWPARWKVPGILLGLILLAALDFTAIALTMAPFFYS